MLGWVTCEYCELSVGVQWGSLPTSTNTCWQNHCSIVQDPCSLTCLHMPASGASLPGKCRSWPKPWKSRKQDSKSWCRSLPLCSNVRHCYPSLRCQLEPQNPLVRTIVSISAGFGGSLMLTDCAMLVPIPTQDPQNNKAKSTEQGNKNDRINSCNASLKGTSASTHATTVVCSTWQRRNSLSNGWSWPPMPKKEAADVNLRVDQTKLECLALMLDTFSLWLSL